MIILPIFDSAKHIENQINFSYLSEEYNIKDLEIIHKYLNLCSSTRAFIQYRKIETLFHWCTLIAKISLIDLNPMDLKKFLEFYKNPPAEWIAIKREHKFKTKNSLRIPNPEWKPFINTGRKNNEDTGKSLIAIFFIFYSFLLKEKYISINPIINHQCKNRSFQNNLNNPAISQLILPIFDDKKYIDKNNNFSYLSKNYCIQDLKQALNFIKIYKNKARYIPIRKEVERLLHWCTLIAKISLKDLTPIDLKKFLEFYKNPPVEWIAIKIVRKFYYKNFIRIPNTEWKPFIKADPSKKTLEHLIQILKKFFQNLMLNKYISNNDFINIKDTLSSLSKTNKNHKKNIVYEHIEPQLSILHRQYIYKAANEMAKQDPDPHERTFFIISIIYSMNLKLIDLIPIEEKHTIKMNNFFCDNNNNWWFKYIKEQNKLQYLPVNNETLESLKRWRKYLGLGPLPTPQDDKPLFLKKIIGGYRSSLSSRDWGMTINGTKSYAKDFYLRFYVIQLSQFPVSHSFR